MKFAHARRCAAFGLLGSALLLGCSSPGLPQGTITLLTGQETDAWSADPAAATVVVDMLQAGNRSTLAELPAPASTITLQRGGGPEGVEVSFEATAFDDQQNPVLHGLSSAVTLAGFDDASLYVFLGRSGFARPLGALRYEHRHPLLTVWPNAYVFITGSDSTGSDDTQLDVYDVAVGSLLQNEPNFSQAATSSLISGAELLLVGDASTVWFDLLDGSSATATAPDGLAFSEVIGGKTLIAADGSEYLVGATRDSGDPSDKVLEVDPNGVLHALVLSEPRLAAACALVEGSLVVAGGSATGVGAEILAPGAASFVPLALPADATQGAGLAELTATSAILAGGHDPASGAASATRTIDLSCTNDCSASELGPLALTLGRAQAFTLATNRVLVVGEADDGETHAFSLDVTGTEPVSVEQLFRERRAGASAALLPNGQVLVVGGDEPGSADPITSSEVFFP